MWDGAQLKQQAKGVLKDSYWPVFAATIVLGLLGGSFSIGTNLGRSLEGHDIYFKILLAGYAGAFLLNIFFVNHLRVGLSRFLMETRNENRPAPGLSLLFWGFSEGRYAPILRTTLIQELHIMLYTLCLIIPGIIKTYEYFYTPYILAENPFMPTKQVLALSKRMTAEEKFEIFVFQLSFIGWELLGILFCGIGLLFVAPYVQASTAELYAFVRGRALATNQAEPQDLPGFDPPVMYDAYGQPIPPTFGQPQPWNQYQQQWQQPPQQPPQQWQPPQQPPQQWQPPQQPPQQWQPPQQPPQQWQPPQQPPQQWQPPQQPPQQWQQPPQKDAAEDGGNPPEGTPPQE